MSTASRGRDSEYRVRDHLIDNGWPFIMRAAASKGSGDLLHGHPYNGALLVQVGRASKTLGPASRHRLVADADLIGAIPVLAVVLPRRPITYWHVTLGKPGSWLPFNPTRGTSA